LAQIEGLTKAAYAAADGGRTLDWSGKLGGRY
jgi:hypothetical protein